DPLGVEQDALGQGGLPRVDVGADPDVSQFGQFADHDRLHTARHAVLQPAGRLRLKMRAAYSGCGWTTPPQFMVVDVGVAAYFGWIRERPTISSHSGPYPSYRTWYFSCPTMP